MGSSTAENARRPSILFSGSLEDDTAIELTDRIRVYKDDLFYDEIQLRISSPGGEISALKFFAEALRAWQADGLKLVTHAITKVGSAAAVMLSIGSFRTAHPKAMLLYHAGRVPSGSVDDTITAIRAQSLATTLAAADEEIVSLLADRAVLSPAPAGDTPPALFSRADWQVISHLSQGNPKKPATKLRKFRERIAEAFKSPETIGQLYSEFCALDTPVSPYLALELGLIDQVGDDRALAETQEQGAATDDGLVIPEWAPLYSGGRVPRAALTRHTLILGETGSGKTVSGVLPVLAAVVRKGSPVSCALVIDPKCELLPIVRGLAGADCSVRLLRSGDDSVNIMAGSRSVAEDVSNGRWLFAAQRILARISGFAESCGRIHAGKRPSAPRNAFWEIEGARFSQCVLAFTLLLLSKPGLLELCSNIEDFRPESRDKLADFEKIAGLDGTATPQINVVAMAYRVLAEFFAAPKRSSMPAADVMEALQKEESVDDDTDAIRNEVAYWDGIRETVNHWSGALGEARGCLSAVADPAPSKSLVFGVEPVQATVDFTKDVGLDTVGRSIYVYQPALVNDDALIAKCLKATFFEAVLASPDRRDRGSKMPLVFYVADEFHRFITSDSGHGEQNFVDSCRSFGAACVLATQSDASVRHALKLAGEPAPDTAIRILMTNTATKIVFRSTEDGTRYLLDSICPGSGNRKVTTIRPPATLRPGEAYISLPDGRFVRRQLIPYVGVDPSCGHDSP